MSLSLAGEIFLYLCLAIARGVFFSFLREGGAGSSPASGAICLRRFSFATANMLM
jgi:hypothetical protein